MFFLRNRRRNKLLTTPLSAEQRQAMHTAAPLSSRLPASLKPRHEGLTQLLLSEKTYEGADGQEITEEIRLCIAAQAALLQLRKDADYFPGLDTILVYPDAFIVDHDQYDEETGLVTSEEADLSGESWTRGVVVLAWADVQREARARDGFNVVLHEFAHQLDDQTGTADGTPLLPDALLAERWASAFQNALEEHRVLLRKDQHVLFDEDSAESPTEFFATAVELFFEYPIDLKQEYPAAYSVLAEYLELDPAGW
jgi:MtfA peptidase